MHMVVRLTIKADTSESSTVESETDNDISSTTGDKISLPKGRTRKRAWWEMTWKTNKRLRNAGKSYVTWKGVVVPPRVTGSDCKCSMGCFKKISSSDRAEIVDGFNYLQTFDVQNAYLHGLIWSDEPKRRYTSQGVTASAKICFLTT